MLLHDYLQSVWAGLRASRASRQSTGVTQVNIGLEQLASCLSLSLKELFDIPLTYTTFSVNKRTGGRRLLASPNKQLKAVQRLLLKRLLQRLPCHPAVHGFVKGKSIATNALLHVGKSVILRMDIKDFFPSTWAYRIESYFRDLGWNEVAAKRLTDLCTFQDGLPQGAPTSPCLSNLVNFHLDRRLQRLAGKHHLQYSRYADDITISFEKDECQLIFNVAAQVKRLLKDYRYTLNSRKRYILRHHQQQRVTGLVVNDHVQLPRKKRRWLRAVRHHLDTNRPATITKEQYDGWLALERMIRDQTDPS